jgi:phosphoglycerate dehydrogenase-like enzyme
MIKGLYIMNRESFEQVYSRSERDSIEEHVHIYHKPLTSSEVLENPFILSEAEVIFSGWGAPLMDKTFIDNAPGLKAVFYAAGSVKNMVTPEFWAKGIRLTSAYAANAVPVSEYTLAQILISLKKGWYFMNRAKVTKTYPERIPVPGAYKRTVGLISLGMIARKVIDLLNPFDLEIMAYDPFTTSEEAEKMGVKLVSLETLFKEADVVSLHTPRLKETEKMITGKLFSLMKKEATFINTARGVIVNEEEMITVLSERKDITALLDVTYPEPPIEGSPLFHMENVFLTPHIAGSLNDECARMGYYMVEELKRYMNNQEFQWNITEDKAKIMA